MERDMPVTVTCDSRVSHTTTTTPHHTYISGNGMHTACMPSGGSTCQ